MRTIEEIVKTLEKFKGVVNVKYSEDLYQDTIFRLLRSEVNHPGFIVGLYERGELDKYFNRSMTSNAFQSGSSYQKGFRDNRFIQYNDNEDLDYFYSLVEKRSSMVAMEDKLNEFCDCILGGYVYSERVFDLYVCGYDNEEIAELTGLDIVKVDYDVSKIYQKLIFRLYLQGHSARSISRKTKISLPEVSRVINKGKDFLREQYKEEIERL